MTTPSILRLLTGFALLCSCTLANAQKNTNTNDAVDAQEEASPFLSFSPFTILHQRDENVLSVAPAAQLLTLNDNVLSSINQFKPENLSISIPYHGELLTFDLIRTEITTSDFTVISERSPADPLPYQPGLHYRGVIRGQGGIVAMSFFDNEIMGLAATPESGNLVLGRLTYRDNLHRYILYSDNEMAVANPFNCHTIDEGGGVQIQTPVKDQAEVDKCVRVFLEADNELFVEKGSTVQGTVNYLLGMFNQSAALYATEQINTIVSQLFVWTTPDIYSTTNSATVLNQFRTFRTQFNGDLAHLVGTGGNNLGGIAYVDVLCSTYNVAFSDITASYNNVPTYSWTVEVFTHEMGHNLGSHHTQWCGWQNGPIDNCVTQEGACNPGPAPVNGGTIMSYCHLTNYGINFSNGFGPQPGNTIRNEVAAATCLLTSCGGTNPCAAPVAITVTNITGSGATIGWTAISGASGYTLRYRLVGAAAWTTVNTPSNPYIVTGLPNNDEVEVTIQSLCGNSSSGYKNGILFITGATGGGGGAACGTPTGLGVTPASTSAVTAWQAVAGAASYSISWKLSTASVWSTAISTTAVSYTITGLTALQTYNVRVAAVCNGVTSAFVTATFTTPSSGGGNICNVPANLTATPTSTTAQSAWTAASGATAYQVQWKTANSSTWGSLVTVTGTGYNVTGLIASTAYNIRVRTVCSSTVSGYITTSFTTLSSGGGGGACAIPTGLTASNISATSARVSWFPSQGAVNYTMRIKLSTSSTWFTFNNLPAAIITVQNLTPSSIYQVEVRSNCSGGVVSAYCTTYSFTTPALFTGGELEDREGHLVIHQDIATSLIAMPNPTEGLFYVSIDGGNTVDVDVIVTNSFGQVVLSKIAVGPNEPIALDISDQPSGVYIIAIHGKNMSVPAKKLIKL